jgi:hypothetical protein
VQFQTNVYLLVFIWLTNITPSARWRQRRFDQADENTVKNILIWSYCRFLILLLHSDAAPLIDGGRGSYPRLRVQREVMLVLKG